jgi:hypothetical protein
MSPSEYRRQMGDTKEKSSFIFNYNKNYKKMQKKEH